MAMTVLGATSIADFTKKHDRARKSFARFLKIVHRARWQHMSEVKATFPATDFDPAAQQYIFDIGGNKYRLMASIDFTAQILTVDAVMTHEQYNRR